MALFPFVVGFGPPEAPGTYVSVAGGTGHYVARPSCSPPEVTDYRDYQAVVGHQWRPIDGFGTRLGLGAQGDMLTSHSKICDSRGCAESDSADRERGTYYAAGAFVTADWKYLGLRMGGHFHTGIIKTDSHGASEDWLPIPLDGGVRAGPEWLYVSAELLGAAPLLSGGGPIALGLGGRVYGTDLWAGYSLEVFQARVSRGFGPLRLGLTGAYGINEGDYSPGKIGITDTGSTEPEPPVHYSLPQYRAAAQLEYSFK